MPRLRCHYIDCTYLEKGYCGAPSAELDPDEGCLTYTQFDEVPEQDDWIVDDAWGEEESELLEEEEIDGDWFREKQG